MAPEDLEVKLSLRQNRARMHQLVLLEDSFQDYTENFINYFSDLPRKFNQLFKLQPDRLFIFQCIVKFPPNIIYDLFIASHSIISIFSQNNISLKKSTT